MSPIFISFPICVSHQDCAIIFVLFTLRYNPTSLAALFKSYEVCFIASSFLPIMHLQYHLHIQLPVLVCTVICHFCQLWLSSPQVPLWGWTEVVPGHLCFKPTLISKNSVISVCTSTFATPVVKQAHKNVHPLSELLFGSIIYSSAHKI